MSDIFDELGPEVPATSVIDELTSATPDKQVPPIAAARNRAASLALLDRSGAPVVDTYQTTVKAINEGNDIQSSKLFGDVVNGAKTTDTKGLMTILGSGEYGMDEKLRAIRGMQNRQDINDTSVLLQSKSLAADSAGETPKQEAARLSAMDLMIESLKARSDVQGLIQAHAASLDSSGGKALGEFLSANVLPFGNSMIQARIAAQQGKSTWDVIKAFALSGSDASNTQQAYFDIPDNQKREFAKKLIDAISQSAGVIMPKDNHYAQFIKVQRMLNGEEPSTLETIMENASPLLDIVGISAEYRAGKMMLVGRSIERDMNNARLALEQAQKARGPTQLGAEGVSPTVAVKPTVASSGAPDTSLLSSVKSFPDQNLAARRANITALENEKAGLLGDLNFAERGDVRQLQAELGNLKAPDTSTKAMKELADNLKQGTRMSSKEARTEAASRLEQSMLDYNASRQRLEGLIETNRQSSTLVQRVADLEKEIAILGKGVPEKAGSTISPVADMIKRIEWSGIIRAENPSAPASIIGLANPSQGRALFKAVVLGESEEGAKALYGTGKVDVIATHVFPQAITEKGVVATRVTNIARDLEMPDAVAPILNQREGIEFTGREIKDATGRVVNDFKSIEGLHVNDAMGGVKFDTNGGILSVNAVYGTAEGGFNNAVEAVEQTKFALKGYGIDDSNIEILAQDGISHKPVSLEEVAGKEGNYFIRVNTDYELSMRDVGSPEWLNVKRNFADRISSFQWGQQGSLARTLVDAASMVHSVYSGAGVRASALVSGLDKIMLDEATKFTDALTSLSKQRQAAVQTYLKEANYNRIKFDTNDLTARGFNTEEIDTVRKWRQFWDTHFYLENYDVVKTLDSQGYSKFIHPTDSFVAKEMNANQWHRVDKYYDPTTGLNTAVTPQIKATMATNKSYFAELRRPTTVNGELVHFISVENNTNSYLRRLGSHDQVLNKLDGYYTMTYKAPKFFDKVTYGPNGQIISRRAIAVAGDTKEAEAFKNRIMGPQASNETYVVRDDSRMMRTGDDDWWDTSSASGRIAQRQRGQMLEDASGTNHLGDGSYIVSPVDSAVRAARSIAGRTVGRPMLENAKARFVKQYKGLLNPDAFGAFKFPDKVSGIGAKGEFTSSQLADARTTWEYIRYLEDGYINSADQVVKSLFNIAANSAGKYGFSKLERKLGEMSENAPASLAKNFVFNAYIATNVLRQIIVQPHQAMRTVAYNLQGILSGKTFGRVAGFIERELEMSLGATSPLIKNKDMDEFYKFIKDSRMLDGVDKQNLVRGSLEAAVDHSNSLKRGLSKVALEYPRVAGFDMGEKLNRLTHLSAVYDMYKRKGFDLTDTRVRAKAYSEAEAIGYDMNFAGDMPYNQNFASVALQFMQVPHKALLQSTNRRLSRGTRAKLLAGDLAFWGVPTWAVANAFTEDLVPDPKVRKQLTEGAESLILNAALKKYFDSDREVDFSSLAPFDSTGFMDLLKGIMTTGADEIVTNSPTGKLLGEQGRVQSAVRMMGTYFKGYIDPEETPVTTVQVLSELAKISSGFNNYQKAKLILDHHEIRDAKGNVMEDGVPDYMGVAQMFGFGSKSLAETIKYSKQVNEWNKAVEKDVRSTYNQVRILYGSIEDGNIQSADHYTRVAGRLLNIYRDNPQAQAKLIEWINQDFVGPDLSLQRKLIKAAGFPDNADVRRIIDNYSGFTDEQKKDLHGRLDTFANPRNLEEE
jgi:hypothetical protein